MEKMTHDQMVENLVSRFNYMRSELLLKASLDITNRKFLVYVIGGGDFGGTVTYSKRLRKFTHITYSDKKNWAVMFSIESRVSHFCYEHYQRFKKVIPYQTWTIKTGREYLLTH